MKYYAREKQDLSEHIQNTATIAKNFATVFGCPKIAHTAGLLHDFGKYTHAFQDYLERSIKGEPARRGEVVHALQGTKFILDHIGNLLISDIIGNITASHHGGLCDSISNGERTLFLKTNKREDELNYSEAINNFRPKINEPDLKREILDFCQKCQARQLKNPYFMLHLLSKALYSCVVDADRCDSAGLKVVESQSDWAKLIKMLDSHLGASPNENKIDKVRQKISKQCGIAGRKHQGTYTLSVPTGGGKTLSSLRFALEHAKEHNLKRIIYIIPYLSILDQTSDEMHKVFMDAIDEDIILEHHSNIEMPEDGENEEKYNLLASRWDSPIVLTTMVQFLETVYSNRASKLRKFHNMSEAILICDEVQALPIKCIHLFNDAVNFLQTFGKSTILLCTATQPHLHNTDRPVLLSEEANIVTIAPEESKLFERVRVQDATRPAMSHEQIAELAKAQIDKGKSTLIIMNTKGDARKVYEQCQYIQADKFFLTTDLCPAHRMNTLAKLLKSLDAKHKQATLCVSTQLIEAGVNVSFACVIRAEAGIDSIIQAAGRCNRNREEPVPQTVYVVKVENEKISCLPSIKEGQDVARRVFREKQGENLLSDEIINVYYKYYFYAQKKYMDYNINGDRGTIYSLLNDNSLARAAYKNQNDREYTGLPCAFQTAAEEFSVIENSQTGIVVPYGDAMKLVDQFVGCYDFKEKMRILKRLQKYTVSVYSGVLEQVKGATVIVDDSFYLLSPDYYDEKEQGLKRDAMYSLLNV